MYQRETPVIAFRLGAVEPPSPAASVFRREFSILVADDSRLERRPEVALPRSTPVATVLVVDDDSGIVSAISEILAFEGYAVETAANGADALRVLDHIEPCVVLLDMRMPVLDGWGFAAQARQRGLTVPIVVMTAAQDARRWAGEIGASGYLAKPFDLHVLLDQVGRYCGPA